MTGATEIAEDYLCAVADRLNLSGDRTAIRTTLRRASGGQLAARGPDGRRASTLTDTGTPLEISVSGGAGKVAPALRYVTETATQETVFAERLAAQIDAVRDLAVRVPNNGRETADTLESFVRTLYPETGSVASRFRSPLWLGVVHHHAVPGEIARFKVYGGVNAVPGALTRLRENWPGFAGLAPLPEREDLFTPVGVAMEVDAGGTVNHKIYLKARYADVGVPMRLVRCFGDPAWEVLSEFVRAGFDAATLYRYQFFVCCSRGAGEPGLGITLMPRRRADISGPTGELAVRHHGTSAAVEALAETAEEYGAQWTCSGVGLGLSPSKNAWKLNVYGAPTWDSDRTDDHRRSWSSVPRSGPSAGNPVEPNSSESPPRLSEARLSAAVSAAGEFLTAHQDPDGYWRDYTLRPGRSESWVTGCVGFALASAEMLLPADVGRAQAVDRAAAALRDSQRPDGWGYHRRVPCDADSTAWAVRLLSMGGRYSASNRYSALLPEMFIRYRTPEGGVRTFASSRVYGSWADEHDEVAPLVGSALHALGDRIAVADIRTRILRRHRDHGGWLPFWWRSEAYASAHSLSFLSRTGGIPPEIAARERADIAVAARCIPPERSVTPMSSFEIAHLLMGAVRVGSAETVERCAEALLSAQLSDGSWPPSLELLVPGRWDGPAEAFADDRRLFGTAMAMIAVLDVLTETGNRTDHRIPSNGNEEQ